jgi:hypothetical protein
VKKSFGGVVIFGMKEIVYSGAQVYPLTGPGCTYYCGNPVIEARLSEFVIRGDSTAGVHSITADDIFLGYGTTPVRPLNCSSDEIWDRATTLSAKDL